MCRFRRIILIAVFAGGICVGQDAAADVYQDTIQPFVETHCNRCHNAEKARADLDLSSYSSDADVVQDFRRWSHVAEFIRDGEMPPEDEEQPAVDEREAVLAALESILLAEANRHAGDPGEILPRRLSNTEYDLSVRDLTGIDIRPTREFPADPAGGEGFDNTGEALTMSPNLLSKLLGASEHIANHLVLKPDGIDFAPFPVTSYADRKKLTELAVIDFYEAHDVDLLAYLEAAWRGISPEHMSASYLTEITTVLDGGSEYQGYLKEVGDLWDALPNPAETPGRPEQLLELERRIQFARKRLHGPDRLITATAENWVISQFALREEKAAVRDLFNPESEVEAGFGKFGRAEIAIFSPSHLGVTPGLRPRGDGMPIALRVSFEPAFASVDQNVVIMHNPVFSRHVQVPQNEEEMIAGKAIGLREFLLEHAPDQAEKLTFREDGSIRLEAPGVLEFDFTTEMLEVIDGRHLLLDFELESGSVLLQGANWLDPAGGGAHWLMDPSGELAQGLIDSHTRFCQTFPSRFVYVDGARGLTAGFHLVKDFSATTSHWWNES